MRKKLAIKGHESRGKAVIEILEMMGGKNCYNLNGLFSENAYYFIGEPHKTEIKAGEYIFGDEDMYLFTCEEFWEKYPFKVGDKVVDGHGNLLTIKAMSWSEDYETMVYDFEETEEVLCAEDIGVVNDMGLKIENGINMNIEFDLTKYSYEVKDGKLVISEKKPKYPDNYEDCVRIAKNIHGYDIYIDVPAYRELLESFVKLLICRDAYWKIAGEEMSLGKPWEPDWNDSTPKYTIVVIGNDLVKHYTFAQNFILAFPIEEMRDAFYENFKDLIEQCKPLL